MKNHCFQLPKLDVAGSSPVARSIMTLAENESRFIGSKFEAQVELAPVRSTKGIMRRIIYTLFL